MVPLDVTGGPVTAALSHVAVTSPPVLCCPWEHSHGLVGTQCETGDHLPALRAEGSVAPCAPLPGPVVAPASCTDFGDCPFGLPPPLAQVPAPLLLFSTLDLGLEGT